MKLGVFAMIPQLNAKVLNGSHQHHQKAKFRLQKSKVKTMLVCFYKYVPEGQTVTGSFYLSVLERLWKRIRRVRPENSAPVSWFLLYDNAPVHRAVAIQEFFSPKTSVRAPSSALLPWFIPLWLYPVPQTGVTIERAPVWRCSRHPGSCDIESSGHTTRRCAEVLPVFARSCHSLYRCRRDVLWIKYR